jgi:hypothetical protein
VLTGFRRDVSRMLDASAVFGTFADTSLRDLKPHAIYNHGRLRVELGNSLRSYHNSEETVKHFIAGLFALVSLAHGAAIETTQYSVQFICADGSSTCEGASEPRVERFEFFSIGPRSVPWVRGSDRSFISTDTALLLNTSFGLGGWFPEGPAIQGTLERVYHLTTTAPTSDGYVIGLVTVDGDGSLANFATLVELNGKKYNVPSLARFGEHFPIFEPFTLGTPFDIRVKFDGNVFTGGGGGSGAVLQLGFFYLDADGNNQQAVLKQFDPALAIPEPSTALLSLVPLLLGISVRCSAHRRLFA